MRRALGAARAAGRWAAIAGSAPARGEVAVFYGHRRVPAPGERVEGGMVKFQRLQATFPNRPRDFNLLYLGSSSLPTDERVLVRLAARRGAVVVLNQDGVAYPAWAGGRTDELNARLRAVLGAAGHVIYQSRFCKEAADRFLGEPPAEWEVLPNAVDTTAFAPAERPPDGEPVLLLAGDQFQPYRLPTALRTLALLPEGRLLVTGKLVEDGRPLIGELGLGERVELVGTLHAARRAGPLPQGARPPAPEGERPVPQRRARGDGLRRSRRPLGNRRDAGAGRRGGCRGPVRDDVGAGRPARPRGPRRRRACRAGTARGVPEAGPCAGRRALRPRAVGRAAPGAVRAAGGGVSGPRVSVVMPVRDAERFLREALDSILAQTLADLELIVVDDGSADSTPAILEEAAGRDPRVRLRRQEPGGLTVALNAGCALARAPLIARMDGDDVMLADRLERQAAFLDEHHDIALLGGGIVLVDEDGREIDREPGRERLDFLERNELTHASIVMRTEAFRALGGYRLDQSEDYDLWLRFDERYGVAALAEPVIRYRLHGGNYSVTKLERQALGFLCVRAAALARRRGEPDPLDGVERLDVDLLERVGVPRSELDRQVISDAVQWAATLTRVDRADESRALLERRRRSRGHPPGARSRGGRSGCSSSGRRGTAGCRTPLAARSRGRARTSRDALGPAGEHGRPRRRCRGGRARAAPGLPGRGHRGRARRRLPADGRGRRPRDRRRGGRGHGAMLARSSRRARPRAGPRGLSLPGVAPRARAPAAHARRPPPAQPARRLLRPARPSGAGGPRPDRRDDARRVALHRPLRLHARLRALADGVRSVPSSRRLPGTAGGRDGRESPPQGGRSTRARGSTSSLPRRWLLERARALDPRAGARLGARDPERRRSRALRARVDGRRRARGSGCRRMRTSSSSRRRARARTRSRTSRRCAPHSVACELAGDRRPPSESRLRPSASAPSSSARWASSSRRTSPSTFALPISTCTRRGRTTIRSTTLEALACGTPVVASRVGGVPEQLTEETGVLVEPGDPDALAAAIEELLGDPARRARMSAACRRGCPRPLLARAPGRRVRRPLSGSRAGIVTVRLPAGVTRFLANPHAVLAAGVVLIAACEYGREELRSVRWAFVELAIAALVLALVWRSRGRLRLLPVLAVTVALNIAWIVVRAHASLGLDFEWRDVYARQGQLLIDGQYPLSEYPAGAVSLFGLEAWLGGTKTHFVHAFLMVPFQLATVAAVWSLRTRWSPWFAAVLAFWPLARLVLDVPLRSHPDGAARRRAGARVAEALGVRRE